MSSFKLSLRHFLLTPDSPSGTSLLDRYFGSGWAFLFPYLCGYGLYFLARWPVNPPGSELSSQGTANPVFGPLAGHMPCLLYIYWGLHVLHLALVVLWLFFAKKTRNAAGDTSFGPAKWAPAQFGSKASWCLLALVFFIPGFYLEWPSDPWEHLRRINEWSNHATVNAHSTWYKSAYFLPYSLSWGMTGAQQLFALNLYYTAVCLLLCWQYYRLARACELGSRASFVFVIIQALFSGNSVFSFYRYYGISSSIYAQIGAVALTRLALDFVSTLAPPGSRSVSLPSLATGAEPNSRCSAPFALLGWPRFASFALIGFCLLLFTVFNHRQGVLIAAIGVAAVFLWKLIQRKRATFWWLLAATLGLNLVFLVLYHRPAVIEKYRAIGYLNSWYGFNLLDLSSAGGDRMLQIFSFLGLSSVIAALHLIAKNHVVGWLTLVSPIALLLPCIAVPFTLSLVRDGEIFAFHRLLLAAPCGLALVVVAAEGFRLLEAKPRFFSVAATSTLLVALTCAVTFSPGRPFYNRFWNTTSQTPRDLTWSSLVSDLTAKREPLSSRILATPDVGLVALSLRQPTTQGASRSLGPTVPEATFFLKRLIPYDQIGKATLVLPDPLQLYTPNSTAAVLSGHWLPTDLALVCSGHRELTALSQKNDWAASSSSPTVLFRKRD